MRNVTSTITLLAKKVRAEGRAMAPIPLEKLEELAEYLQRVDRLLFHVEIFASDGPWTAEAAEQFVLQMRAALREVQS